MYLKKKIIACLAALLLMAGVVPMTAKAMMTNGEMEALIVKLEAQIVSLTRLVNANSTARYHAVNQTETHSVASQTATNNSNVAIEKWAKNPATGECVTATGVGQPGWLIYSSQATCQAANNSCVISGDSCVQSGKAYPLTNTCTNGATPSISMCSNYGTYCVPVVRCSNSVSGGKLTGNCDQECKNRGFASGSCIGLSGWMESKGLTNPYDNQNTIGKTDDCITYQGGGSDYCGCNLADDLYTGPGAGTYPFMHVSSCEALCKKNGYTFGSCHVLANQSQMVCSGANENDYIGTTDVCKSGASWAAGCCCNSIAGRMITAITGAGTKANGQVCASNTECSSGNCNYAYCAPANGCGGVVAPMYFANGATASNLWLVGICRNGVWKTLPGGNGCNSFACDSGTCSNDKCSSSTSDKRADGATCSVPGDCVSNVCLSGYCGLKPNTWACGANSECASNSCVSGKCAGTVTVSTKKANGLTCNTNGDCTSSVCNYAYCVPDSNSCGGVENPMYFSNGQFASNAWFGGYCRNGAWKVAIGNIGCGGDLSFPCDSGSCVNGRCQ